MGMLQLQSIVNGQLTSQFIAPYLDGNLLASFLENSFVYLRKARYSDWLRVELEKQFVHVLSNVSQEKLFDIFERSRFTLVLEGSHGVSPFLG